METREEAIKAFEDLGFFVRARDMYGPDGIFVAKRQIIYEDGMKVVEGAFVIVRNGSEWLIRNHNHGDDSEDTAYPDLQAAFDKAVTYLREDGRNTQ